MTQEVQDLQLKDITTVQLPASVTAQKQFLKKLQAALAPEGELSALTTGPSENVFVVPHAAEQAVREKQGHLSTDQWKTLLEDWGALSVNTLALKAYIALETRGAILHEGELISPPKISIPHPEPQVKYQGGAVIQAAFAGPYDWHIDQRSVGAAEAWRMFSGKPSFASDLPWAGVRIAHIDTGYTEHAALGWDSGHSPYVHPDQGRDFWQGDHDQDGPRDPFLPGFPGHGTRISAAIAGFRPDAQGGPFYGVAPGAQIIPYRVTDSVIVDHVQDHIRDAIRAAIASGCHVVNISLGALRPSRALAAALDDAYDAGLIVVCAAGQVWGEVIYPGRFNRCITMGGVGPGLKPWSSAATGIYVDLCGPADEIRRVQAEKLPPGQTATQIAPKTGDGTSYATACCSGAAALWLAWHGLDKLKQKYSAPGLWQIPKAFKYLARKTARKGNWPDSITDKYGSGVLDIPALLKAPLPDAGTMRKENLAYGQFDDGSL
ncbi:S8 family peptidase [Hydrogenophaga sp.]|uniref:S8 family peptidase n=1 Tax=Hydrogenophaga sp. TaxID=1904254 RepID=UPI003F72D9D4